MKTEKFNYHLPENLIAFFPVVPRDSSRLMVLNRKNKRIEHNFFSNLPGILKKGDLLVVNRTKVFPARLIGKYQSKIFEILLLKERANTWECLIKPKPKKKITIDFGKKLKGEIIALYPTCKIKFNFSKKELLDKIAEIGKIPLPPYILKKRVLQKEDENFYQTVFSKNLGSAAAPTAGLHFTPALIDKLKKRGINFAFVTLHIGLGTFSPIRTQNIEDFKIHSEFFILNQKEAFKINQAKKNKKRVIAIGTSALRALESEACNKTVVPSRKWTNIYIYTGYKFKIADGLITNFHAPCSTPLILVCALGGYSFIIDAYKKAIQHKYRFLSYGDAMLIL